MPVNPGTHLFSYAVVTDTHLNQGETECNSPFEVNRLANALLAAGLGFIGLDFITSVSGAASAIANVGPGLGPIIGPGGNYSSLPAEAKWLLSAGMLLGRLELFTVLVLLSRSFWRG